MFIYKRSSIAKGIVKHFVKESNLSGKRVGWERKGAKLYRNSEFVLS